MTNSLRLILGCAILCAILGLWGCAAKHARVTPQAPASVAATQPLDPRANLALDEIEPKVSLPAPATQPSTPPPLEAIELYARARGAMNDNQGLLAMKLLEQALTLDAYSFDIYHDLALTYLASSPSSPASDRAMQAMEKAAALRPDRLDLQYELGRQYSNRSDWPHALEHLRLARVTSGYRSERESDTAAMVDFFLARTLRQSGYTAAALETYESLLHRLQRPILSARTNPELLYFARHPENLYVDLGELYEKRGSPGDALHAYQLAAKTDDGNFDLAARVVRTTLATGQVKESRECAAALVAKFHASTDSLEVLRDIHARSGDAAGFTAALAKVHADHPSDRLVFYALLDQLKSTGRTSDAEKLLITATRDTRSDPDITRRLFDLYTAREDVEAAMRLLVDSLADRPDSLREVGPMWAQLLKPARRSRVRLRILQEMKVPPREEAARLFWVSRMAEVWSRDALARATLEQAAALTPPFAPVYRWLIGEEWGKADWDDKQKIQACKELADRVETQGDKALAAELRGRSLLMQRDYAAASQAFASALALGNRSPDLQLMHARSLFKEGNEARAEQLLWKLVSDWPQYEEAYSELFNLYLERRVPDQAVNVLRKWLEADPTNIDARLLQATIYAQLGRPEMLASARTILLALFTEQPGNLKVLSAMEDFYRHFAKLDELIVKLEDERTKNPDNREAVEVLVQLYADQKRIAEASRVLDAARAAVATDPDLLYYVAHLYERIEQKGTTEEILQEVVRLDPRHAPASNDLGYTWADAGKNLDRAEALVRVAVEAEPDNQSYLDSMGWVEYKRGKFSEARGFLDRAIGPANRPDPVVLDHLGDVLYRLDHPKDAVKTWKRSLQRLDETNIEREDYKQLRLMLTNKLKQQEQGQPVNVAPVVENRGKPTQAKN